MVRIILRAWRHKGTHSNLMPTGSESWRSHDIWTNFLSQMRKMKIISFITMFIVRQDNQKWLMSRINQKSIREFILMQFHNNNTTSEAGWILFTHTHTHTCDINYQSVKYFTIFMICARFMKNIFQYHSSFFINIHINIFLHLVT